MTVYLIQCQQTYNVKIGYTSRLVQTRLAELRTAASTPIELVKWYPRYSEADEQALHEIFARYRVTGEWFKSDVLTLIDHEIEMMGMIGDRDYEAKAPNGAEITPAVMTVNVAVLKIGTQNMKQSFFEQLPVEEGFTCDAKYSCNEKFAKDFLLSSDYKGIVWSSHCQAYWCEILNYEIREKEKEEWIYNHDKQCNERQKTIVLDEGFLVQRFDKSRIFLPFDKISGYVIPPKKANIVLSPGRLWGMIDIPIKHYGNVRELKRYWLFENDGQLVRRTFENINRELYRDLAPNYAEVRAMLDNAQQLFLV